MCVRERERRFPTSVEARRPPTTYFARRDGFCANAEYPLAVVTHVERLKYFVVASVRHGGKEEIT